MRARFPARLDGIGDDAGVQRPRLGDNGSDLLRLSDVLARDRKRDLEGVEGELCARTSAGRVFLRSESHAKGLDLDERSDQARLPRRAARAVDLDALGIDAGFGKSVDEP